MPKTIEQGFASFLSGIQPSATEHSKVTSHRESVERCLVSNFECNSFFETGSYGSSTGVRHFSDTDYFAVIPAAKLSDDSSLTLRRVKEALQVKYSSTANIGVKCPAVSVPFGIWASEKMEITPAFFGGFKEYDGKKFRNYEIPDCEGGWMYSSPDAHNYYVQKVHDAKGQEVKTLVQMMKAWKYYNEVPISSFFLELYTTRYCAAETAIVYEIDLKDLFKSLAADGLPGLNDPVGISGRIKPCSSDAKHAIALSKIQTAASRAQRAYDSIHSGNLDESFRIYDLLFNMNFPAR